MTSLGDDLGIFDHEWLVLPRTGIEKVRASKWRDNGDSLDLLRTLKGITIMKIFHKWTRPLSDTMNDFMNEKDP